MMYRTLLALSFVGLAANLSPADSIPGRILGSTDRNLNPQDFSRSPTARGSLDLTRKDAAREISKVFPGAARAISMPAGVAGPGLGNPKPRREMPKREIALKIPRDPQTGATLATGRLVVKFRDHLRFRAPLAPIDRPMSDVDPAEADAFAVVLANHGGTIAQWINRTPEQLAALERRALEHSGKAQPDLAGIMAVSFPKPLADEQLEAVAREIQGLDAIEFVWVEQEPELHQCGPNPKPDAPVAAPGTVCNTVSASCGVETPPNTLFPFPPAPGAPNPYPPVPPWDASLQQVPLFLCNNQDIDEEDRGGWWGCSDTQCCELVADLLEPCDADGSDNGWDALCAAYANLVCEGTIFDGNRPELDPDERYNPCLSEVGVFPDTGNYPSGPNLLFEPYLNVLSGPCGKPHPGRGCNLSLCCFRICEIDPFCCAESWDLNCASLSTKFSDCTTPVTPFPTPSFLAAQKYLSGNRVEDPAASQWQGSFFYGGEGLDLDGLLRVQEDLERAYGLGPVLDHGKSINVAVIEFSAFVNHEDFVLRRGPATVAQAIDPAAWDLLPQPKVIPEPNQTILLIPGANNDPEHGTAALSIIVAARQGDDSVAPPIPEVGGHGIAYNAQGYFFPIVSMEEGSRAQNAFIACFETFGPGDVTNNSWGFPPDGTVCSVEPYNLLIRFGSDLGITTVVSAGNSSVRVRPQPLDSGAIVVGASTPGTQLDFPPACLSAAIGNFGRLDFSNFTDLESEFDPDTGHRLGLVDVSAWGQDIFSCGAYPGQGFGYQVGRNLPFPGSAGNPLEENKLRTYTQGFSGTSGAGPIIAGSVALLQATAKQAFGGPLSPEQIRAVVSGYGRLQCDSCCSVEPDNPEAPFPPDCCPCGSKLCEFDAPNTPIGVCMPFLDDAGVGVITGGFPDGNRTEIQVLKGYPVNGPPASVFIRAPDGNYLRLGTEQVNAGQRVDGLTYFMSGPTTDIYAKLRSNITNPDEIENLGLVLVGRSNAQVTIVGGFLFNYRRQRWDFIGVDFYGPATQEDLIVMPVPGVNLESYFDESGVFRARVWTCGLGLSGPHQVWHDLINLGVNDPTLIPPGP